VRSLDGGTALVGFLGVHILGLTRAAASVSGEAAQEHGEGCRSRPAAVVRSATAVLAGAAHLSGQSSAAGLIRATPE